MGRPSYSNKAEVDDTRKISTHFLKKYGYFEGRGSGMISWTNSGIWGEHKSSVGVEASLLGGDNYLRIHYTQTDNQSGDKKDFDYKIPLTFTTCRYGGKRYWFVCPWYKNGVYCGKRVGTLYKGGDYFACRHCYDLIYSSKKQNRRSKFFSIWSVIDTSDKIEKAGENVKRPFYAGRPTRKLRRLMRLNTQYSLRYQQFLEFERRKLI